MMKNLIKVFTFLTILLVIIFVMSIISVPNHKYGMYKVARYEILQEEENSIDVLFMGDSLVYSSVSPMELWSNYGFTSYDCSEPAQIIGDTYKYLENTLQHEHPKIIFIEANILYRDPSKKPFFRTVHSEIKNIFPVFKYHNNWKNYFKIGSKDEWLNIEKGYKYITKVEASYKKNYMKKSKKSKKFLPRNITDFERIYNLCKDNDIELVLFSLPSQKMWNYKKHLGVEKLSNKYNIKYIDLNLESSLNIDWTLETKDRGDHLNYKGAIKVSNYLGDYLKNNTNIVDHRDDVNYKNWHKAYNLYSQKVNQ